MSYLTARLMFTTTKPSTWPGQQQHLNTRRHSLLGVLPGGAARLHCLSTLTLSTPIPEAQQLVDERLTKLLIIKITSSKTK